MAPPSFHHHILVAPLPVRPGRRLALPLALPLALLLAVLTVLAAPSSWAYPNEEEGFAGLRWGATLQELLEKRPALRKQHTLAGLSAALQRSKGGILVSEIGPYLGFADAEIRYAMAPSGLYQVEISLVDSAPASYARGGEVSSKLAARHGPPTSSEGRLSLWKGEKTVIRLQELQAMSGIHLVLSFTRRSDYDRE